MGKKLALNDFYDRIASMTMDSGQKTYEISFLINPLVSEDDIGGEVAKLRETIEKNGGFVMGEEPARMQKLSYSMKLKSGAKSNNFDSAYFGWMKFYSKPESVEGIKKSTDANENIIRHLITDAMKESATQPQVAAGIKRAAPVKEVKEDIKPEQIDEKLEEMLNK